MDLIKITQEKSFLGQEFLTWLWWMCEDDASFTLPDGRTVALALGERMSLAPPWGHEGSRVALAGKDHILAEAREALRQGKLVDNIRIAFVIDSEDYWTTLDAMWLTPRSVRLPATASAEEQGLDSDTMVLERLALLENLTTALNSLFATFMELRIKHQYKWPELKTWIS